jgi:ribosomal protein L23
MSETESKRGYWHIIRKVLFTEKSYEAQEDDTKPSVYHFQVLRPSRKPEIKKAVCQAFGLEPADILSVRTMIIPGKFKRRGRAKGGYTSERKKAIVTLKAGKIIEALQRG